MIYFEKERSVSILNVPCHMSHRKDQSARQTDDRWAGIIKLVRRSMTSEESRSHLGHVYQPNLGATYVVVGGILVIGDGGTMKE